MTWYHHHFQPVRRELVPGKEPIFPGCPGPLGEPQPCYTERRIVAPEEEWAALAEFCEDAVRGELPEQIRVLVGELFEPWEGRVDDMEAAKLLRMPSENWKPLTPADIRARFFALADECPGVDFMCETRWPERVREAIPVVNAEFWNNPTPEKAKQVIGEPTHWRSNFWLAVTISTQSDADRLLPLLQDAPAAKRMARVRPTEPIVGLWQFVDWVVVDTSSVGIYHFDEIRSIVAQCQELGVPVWVEEWPGMPSDLQIQETPRP